MEERRHGKTSEPLISLPDDAGTPSYHQVPPSQRKINNHAIRTFYEDVAVEEAAKSVDGYCEIRISV